MELLNGKAAQILGDPPPSYHNRIPDRRRPREHELEDLFKQKIDLVSRRAIKPRYLPFVEKSLIHV